MVHDVGRARGDLAEHQRLRLRREAEAAVLLGDEHAEEAVLLDEVPDLARGSPFGRGGSAQSLTMRQSSFVGPVEERLLLLGQRDGRHGAQLVPVGLCRRTARHRSRWCRRRAPPARWPKPCGRMPLILRNAGSISAARRSGRDGQAGEHDDRQPGQQRRAGRTRLVELAVQQARLPDQRGAASASGPAPQRRAPHGQHEHASDAKEEENELCHGCRLPAAPSGASPIQGISGPLQYQS